MPFLSIRLLDQLVARAPGWDATVPLVDGRMHYLHAVYARSAFPVIRGHLASGDLRMGSLLPALRVQVVGEGDLNASAADLRSFWNVNTPEEWAEADRFPAEQL